MKNQKQGKVCYRMNKLQNNRIYLLVRKYWIVLFILGTAVYFGSCIVINFIGRLWYNVDMYSDAFVAELMADEMTLFPSSWTFGNQYYVVATPVLGAIIFKIIGNSFYAMALASSLMMVGIYLSYIWCVKPFVKKKVLIVGLFALSGGILFGTSASNSILGFQLLYTMASYYACYTIGIFFTAGIFLRIYKGISIRKFYLVVAILLNFTLGMHSLRETLILNIPLVLMSFYLFFIKAENGRKTILFSLAMLLSNGVGIILMKILIKVMNIRSNPVISKLEFYLFDKEHFVREIRQFSQMLGLHFLKMAKFDKICILLFISAILTILCVIFSVVRILFKKDTSPLALMILLCFVSMLLVICVGLVLFYNRDTYYFMWYFLVMLSVCYCLESLQGKRISKGILLCLLLFIGMVNYYCNFYTDFVHYRDENEFYNRLTEEISEDDIQYIYAYEWDKAYPIYCYSNNRIKIGIYDGIYENGLVNSLQCLKCDYVFEKENLDKAYFIFSEDTYQVLMKDEKENFENLLSRLQFVKEINYESKRLNENVKIYKPKEDVFYREND